mmetsp:Transcript_2212/g.5229  ORF Transcript_2212/g.5229 Transcript_2212/m.5229 type:complete len:220 (-) Transcript_2212:279-938(-)
MHGSPCASCFLHHRAKMLDRTPAKVLQASPYFQSSRTGHHGPAPHAPPTHGPCAPSQRPPPRTQRDGLFAASQSYRTSAKSAATPASTPPLESRVPARGRIPTTWRSARRRSHSFGPQRAVASRPPSSDVRQRGSRASVPSPSRSRRRRQSRRRSARNVYLFFRQSAETRSPRSAVEERRTSAVGDLEDAQRLGIAAVAFGMRAAIERAFSLLEDDPPR